LAYYFSNFAKLFNIREPFKEFNNQSMSFKFTGFIILFLFAWTATAQEKGVVIERSSETVVIEGDEYYVHTVRKGETLFSICRAYNVSQKDVLLKNPSAYIGLQIGQVLHIPVVPEEEPEEPEVRDTDKYIYHEIEEGHTLFFLSQSYNVSAGEIEKLNPGLEVDNLQIGQVVKIPRRAPAIVRKGFDTEDDRYIHHRVEKGETRWSISKMYGIEEEELLKANEKLAWGLRAGEYIRIPREPGEPVEKETVTIPPAEEKAEPVITDVADAGCIDFDYEGYDKPFNVALMLPLFIERNYPLEMPDTVEVDGRVTIKMKPVPGHVESVDELHPATVPFLEFYQGALIALDSLKEAGLSVNLHVYDTQRNPATVHSILEKREMRNIDLVIGPVYPEVIKIVSEWSRKNGVSLVSPFSARTEFLSQNPRFFQVMPTLETELEQASYFISNYPGHNVVLIHSGNIREMDTVEKLKRTLFSTLSSSGRRLETAFKEVVYDDSVAENLHHSLKSDKPNIVIIPSSNQAFVAGVLNRLNIMSNRFDITLFGLNDWTRFLNIDVEYFHNMELHYASPFFVDFSCDHVKYFLRNYRRRYNSEPQYYGFNGYDVTLYFLSAMKTFGSDFQACLPLLNVDLLQSDFMFRKSNPRYGFENNGLSIVKYTRDMNIMNLGLNRDPITMMFTDISEDTDDEGGGEEE